MNTYYITRTRLVKESFRVLFAESEQEAIDIMNDEMDLPQVTENCALDGVETISSEVEFTAVEEVL